MIRSVELSQPAALIGQAGGPASYPLHDPVALTSVQTLAVTSGVEITSNEV